MGKLAVQKYFAFMILILTVLMMIFTIVGLFGGDVFPGGNMARALLVYVLPLLMAGNLVLLIYWLILRRWHWAVMPLFTLLCCIPYSQTIYKFGSTDETADSKQAGLKIATYNVARFNGETTGFIAQDILAEMKKQKVDILCMQEYNDWSADKRNSESYKEYFPYMQYGLNDRNVIYSRFPIKKSASIEFPASNNSAQWVDVDVNGQLFRVYNVHLETAGAHHVMHHANNLEADGYNVQSNRLLEAVYGTYTIGMIKRAGQANILAQEIQSCEHPVILAGDCVDVPYSYVYNTLKGELTDGFKECGSGWMHTLRGKTPLRIDYIFHDKNYEGINCYMKELSYSDHNPVFMKIALK
jgi:endonuclease/exonuclease/phosphatase family metal-dependent hydrolase